MTNDEMPKDIWAWKNQGTFWTDDPNHGGITSKIKYIRADLFQPLIRVAADGAVSVQETPWTEDDQHIMDEDVGPMRPVRPPLCTRKHLDEATSEECMRRYMERDGT